jgi:hypothetical protein
MSKSKEELEKIQSAEGEEELEVVEPPLIEKRATNTYEMFETDSELETEGVWFSYSFGAFKLSYVGGQNQGFAREYSDLMKPYAEAQDRGLMDPKILRGIQIKCYAKHIVQDWRNVTDRNGDELTFTVAACEKLFLDLPELFQVVRNAATNFANYRKIYAESALGNS